MSDKSVESCKRKGKGMGTPTSKKAKINGNTYASQLSITSQGASMVASVPSMQRPMPKLKNKLKQQ